MSCSRFSTTISGSGGVVGWRARMPVMPVHSGASLAGKDSSLASSTSSTGISTSLSRE